MKKVLVITYYFPPSGGAGVQRWLKFIKYLPEFNIEPIVLTVDETCASYPQIDESLLNDIPKNSRIEKTKTCEVLSLYKKASPNKSIPYGGFANEKSPNLFQKISRFIRGNFFLPDPRRGWNKYAYKKACQIIEQENIDCIITTSPPHSTQLIGLKLKRKYSQLRWIADLRDPWSDIYYNKDLYQTYFAKKLNAKYEKDVLAMADDIITVSEDCKRGFLSKLNTIDKKINVIANGYDEDDFEKIVSTKGDKNKFIITYTGVLSPQYDINTLINSCLLLSQDIKSKLLLRFVGNVCDEFESIVINSSLNYEFINYVEHKKAIAYMQQSDILLLVIPNIKENNGILTGKLFEYLASNKPILQIGAMSGDAANIIKSCNTGRAFNYDDNNSVLNFISDVFNREFRYSGNGISEYSRRVLTEKLSKLL